MGAKAGSARSWRFHFTVMNMAKMLSPVS